MSKKIDRKFKRELTRVLEDVNSKYYLINSGGCGFLAKKLHDILTSLGYDVKLILIYRDKDIMAKGNEIINSNSNNNKKINVKGLDMLGWTHIMIRVNGLFIDSKGINRSFKDKNWGRVWGYLPLNILNEMVKPNSDITWNPSFNTKFKSPISRKLNQLAIN